MSHIFQTFSLSAFQMEAVIQLSISEAARIYSDTSEKYYLPRQKRALGIFISYKNVFLRMRIAKNTRDQSNLRSSIERVDRTEQVPETHS